jgi:hypothetical protein
MIKETKSTYRKRKIIIGLAIFLATTLVAGGFASFVISTQRKSQANGNITIGKIQDNSISISDAKLSQNKICFEPQKDDTSGRVRYDGKNHEIISTTLTCTFLHPDMVSGINIKLNLPTNIAECASEGYITLPSYVSDDNGYTIAIKDARITDYYINGVLQANTKYLTYTFEFGWGEIFNSLNPGYYYDSDPTGINVSDEEMSNTLTSFRSLFDQTSSDKTTMSIDITPILN